ncbi:hypothetical protein SMIR_42365 (plasmid) [Streptomyces mirabilis]|uniref:hypothetical protein n=1 Tax=Streptomyces mirabilis TaxID=68239 RepID=UPI001BAE7A77|nr:hypothetical protein [Streptomyces mirabilis]QUW85687.1 hypothetical protein SMIR_42365 [Streptomyces mirabilis]
MRVQPLLARRWAGLLAVLALALCTTALAQPAMAVPTDTRSMDAMPMTSTMPQNATDQADAGERAEPSCPMDDMVMDCQPSAQHRPARPASVPLPLAARTPSTAADEVAGRVGVERAPPSPASREGPDLDRLCVSRT